MQRHRPGDTYILNASCLLAGIGYPANAVTAAKTEVLLLPARAFRQLLDSHSGLQLYVYTMLSQRLTAIMGAPAHRAGRMVPPYALLGFSTCGKCSTPLKQP